MKCLLCTHIFEDEIVLNNHYIQTDRVNSDDSFFKVLFQKSKKKTFFIRKCYRCDKILTSQYQEKIRNSMKHYQEGGQLPIKGKAMESIIGQEKKKIFINFEKHKDSYDFIDGFRLPQECFNIFNIKFNTNGEKELIFKSTFGVVNYQPPPDQLPGAVGILDKILWSTQTYEGRFFNKFIRHSLIYDIRKRVIVNEQNGSSWRFYRYDFISITITEEEGKILYLYGKKIKKIAVTN